MSPVPRTETLHKKPSGRSTSSPPSQPPPPLLDALLRLKRFQYIVQHSHSLLVPRSSHPRSRPRSLPPASALQPQLGHLRPAFDDLSDDLDHLYLFRSCLGRCRPLGHEAANPCPLHLARRTSFARLPSALSGRAAKHPRSELTNDHLCFPHLQGPPTLFDTKHAAHKQWAKTGKAISKYAASYEGGLKGIVFVSAHWESDNDSVLSSSPLFSFTLAEACTDYLAILVSSQSTLTPAL